MLHLRRKIYYNFLIINKMHILSKSTYIKGEQCEKALYLFKNRPFLRDKLSMEQRAKFKRGTDVGILAQQLFPGGINMTPSSPSQFDKKAAETLQNLTNPDVNVMYEAVFQHNDTLIMVDMKPRGTPVREAISSVTGGMPGNLRPHPMPAGTKILIVSLP